MNAVQYIDTPRGPDRQSDMPTTSPHPGARLAALLTLAALTLAPPGFAASSWVGPTDAEVCFREAQPTSSTDAIQACTAAIRSGELTLRDLGATYNNRGILNARAGNTSRALADYARALEIDPDSAHTWLNQANLYARTGQLDKALESYARAISLSEERWALPYFNRALAHLKQGNRVAAREDLLRAISLDPHSLKYREALAGTEFASVDPP